MTKTATHTQGHGEQAPRRAKPPQSPQYNALAVDEAIARSRQKISRREASLIHRLLKGHGR